MEDLNKAVKEFEDYIKWAHDADRLYKDEYNEITDHIEKIKSALNQANNPVKKLIITDVP